jgi:hypothetical protein
MLENPFPLKPNEKIETKFGIIFFCNNKDTIEIHFKNVNYEIFRVTQNIAEIFYGIINHIYLVNKNLIFQIGTVKNCYYFTKRILDISQVKLQHEVFWIFFQKTAIKIQLSMSIKNQFNIFYKNNQHEFDRLMNTNSELVESILAGNNNPDRRQVNKITRYGTERVNDWLNFNLVSTEPLPLLFEFFKDLKIIKHI